MVGERPQAKGTSLAMESQSVEDIKREHLESNKQLASDLHPKESGYTQEPFPLSFQDFTPLPAPI